MSVFAAFRWSVDGKLFGTTFTTVALAELPDKTAIATLILATGNRPLAVAVGVGLAFLVQTIIAVLCGSFFALLPPMLVRIFVGILFLAFAVVMWRPDDSAEELDASGRRVSTWLSTAWVAFLVIFVAEWGDLTQIATAALVAGSRQPLTVFTASVAALWTVTVVLVLLGRGLGRWVPVAILRRTAAVIFAILGIAILCGFSFGVAVGVPTSGPPVAPQGLPPTGAAHQPAAPSQPRGP